MISDNSAYRPRDNWEHGRGLKANCWPTISESNELFATLRAGWLRPYRAYHGSIMPQTRIVLDTGKKSAHP